MVKIVDKQPAGTLMIKDLATMWKVTQATVRGYQNQGLEPSAKMANKNGSLFFDRKKAEQWYAEYRFTPAKETTNEADLRLKKAKASIEEYKLSTLYGENINQANAITVLGQILIMVDQKLKEVSVNAAPHVASCNDTKECINIIDKYIESARAVIRKTDIQKLIKQSLKVKDDREEDTKSNPDES